MNRLLYSLFGLSPRKMDHDPGNDQFDQIVQGAIRSVRDADPETPQQWARLRNALAHRQADAIPAKSRAVPRFAFALALIAVAAIGVSLYFVSTPAAPEIVLTGRGEQKQITLADGSEVRLHHTTELVVSSMKSGMPRRVSLKGEAFFRVRRNDMPFIITTDQASVEVLGTEFNVRIRDESLEVAVIGGKVRVTAAGGGSDSTLVLTQNQMAVSQHHGSPRFAGTIPSSEYPGWMSGKLFLDKTPFADACREIELRFDTTIAIRDKRVGSKAITGILDAKTVRTAVAALCELTGTQYAQEGNAFEIF